MTTSTRKPITWKTNDSAQVPPMWILWSYVEAYQVMGLDWQVA